MTDITLFSCSCDSETVRVNTLRHVLQETSSNTLEKPDDSSAPGETDGVRGQPPHCDLIGVDVLLCSLMCTFTSMLVLLVCCAVQVCLC